MDYKNQDTKEVFAKNLKKFRKRKGINQAYLAEKLGVRANTISNYENAISFPDPNALDMIVNILEVSHDALFSRGYGGAEAGDSWAMEDPGGYAKEAASPDLLELIDQLEAGWTGDPMKISRLKTEIMKLYRKVSEAENKIISLQEELRKRLEY